MGFSPFELLFRRKPQSVLDLVKENWEMGPSTSKNEGQHILDLWDFTPGPETSTASIQQRSKTHPVIKCLYCYHHLAPNSSPSGTGLLWSHGEWGMLTMRLCILTGVEQHIFTTSTSLKPGRRWRLFLWLPQWSRVMGWDRRWLIWTSKRRSPLMTDVASLQRCFARMHKPHTPSHRNIHRHDSAFTTLSATRTHKENCLGRASGHCWRWG